MHRLNYFNVIRWPPSWECLSSLGLGDHVKLVQGVVSIWDTFCCVIGPKIALLGLGGNYVVGDSVVVCFQQLFF